MYSMYSSLKEMLEKLDGICEITKNDVNILDKRKFSDTAIDSLVYNGVFNNDHNIQDACRWVIWTAAQKMGVVPSSIQGLYEARGRGECSGFTVPAINVRGLTYDTSRAIFRAAIKNNVGPFIFEIARSEMIYTYQRPEEYAVVVLAAGIKEKYSGPVFIQGDHFQFSAKKFKEDPIKETGALKELTAEALEAGFYNIDIDSSTLVELEKSSISEQQKNNYDCAAAITEFIRAKEPKGITVSVGGEIGEVGGKNSTAEELRGFMDGFVSAMKKVNPSAKGLSKISIQTGTSHGGVVLPDGSVAKVKLDFDILRDLSVIARTEYGMSGAVQHGASTLPDDAFNRFPETETAEVHLATGFQNMIYESASFPNELRDEIYAYLHKESANEKKDGQTDEQFIYKTRKKGFGPFKKKMWDMPKANLEAVSAELEAKFVFLFKKLAVTDTKAITEKHISLVKAAKAMPKGLMLALEGKDPVSAKKSGRSSSEQGYSIDEIGE